MRPAVSPGDRFGAWLAQAKVPAPSGSSRREPKWLCRCDCGTESEVVQGNLQNGKSKSCGCSKRISKNKTHGMSKDPAMVAWRNLISRCTDSECAQYKDYGGRGITVAPEFLDFATFFKEVGARPNSRSTLDRIENSRGYEPGNIRWTTWREQTRNKRNNRMVEFDGRVMCVQDWAAELGVKGCQLYYRCSHGMTWQEAIQDILNNPPEIRKLRRKPRKLSA